MLTNMRSQRREDDSIHNRINPLDLQNTLIIWVSFYCIDIMGTELNAHVLIILVASNCKLIVIE